MQPHRLSLLLLAVVLSACRLEPGAMLGAGEDADCAYREVFATGWGTSGGVTPVDFGVEELQRVMMMYHYRGRLQIDFRPRIHAGGIPKLAALKFARLRAEGAIVELLERSAICKDVSTGDGRSTFSCTVEKRGDYFDRETFYFASMDVQVGEVEFHYDASGRPSGCRFTGTQNSDVKLNGVLLPTVVPDEMPATPEEEE